MEKEVMSLIDENTGKMKCRICGAVHSANRKPDGEYHEESYWCVHGCRFEDED